MSDPYSKREIIEHLKHIESDLAITVDAIAQEQFYVRNGDEWSASDYLKHLLLSVKPFAKGMNFPPTQIKKLFGEAERPSMTYTELVAVYQGRLDDGVRAEDYEGVTPFTFRIPEGTSNVREYLVEAWHETHQKLYAGLEQWSEEDLDTHQMVHPAIGAITVREMLFFTIHHNRLHANDIRIAGALA